jgi:hypothetical protein
MATEIPRTPAPDEYDAPRKGNWQGFDGPIPHCHLGQLEHHVSAVAHDPGADLDQFFAERRQRPLFDLFRQSQRAQEVRDVVGERAKLEAHCVVPEARQDKRVQRSAFLPSLMAAARPAASADGQSVAGARCWPASGSHTGCPPAPVAGRSLAWRRLHRRGSRGWCHACDSG